MKSRSDSKPQASKWRLSKTLKRKPQFRDVSEGDLKYAWAAYKRGSFDGMIEEELDPRAFAEAFGSLGVAFHGMWTFLDDGKPVGMGFAFMAHPEPVLAPYMIFDRVIWFDWATPRQRIEHGVNFFNEIRKEFPVIGHVDKENKSYFEMMCKHGVIRRVGTSHNLDKAVFETRAP